MLRSRKRFMWLENILTYPSIIIRLFQEFNIISLLHSKSSSHVISIAKSNLIAFRKKIKTICHVIFCLFFCQKSVYIIFCRIKKALNSNTQSLTWWRHKNQLNMLRSSSVAAEGFYFSALFYASSSSTSPKTHFTVFSFLWKMFIS